MAAYIFSALALLISVVSFFVLFSYIKRRTSIDRIPVDVRNDVEIIIQEINRITDRDSELIEERIQKTKELLAKLDKELALYETGIANLINTKDTLKKIDNTKKAQSEKDYKEAGRRAIYRSAAEPVNTTSIEDQAAGPVNTASIEDQAAGMAAAGLPNKIIAARLHKTITEIEMMLVMRSK
ncbi:hypothetical protein FACS189494_00480 [Spirochaetia bacterium]|nr:hypothetical protein FACS189494_00480 [Spirochaetia bacterium]